MMTSECPNFAGAVMLDELEENSYGGEIYEVIKKNYGRIEKPFQVRVIGKDRLAIQHVDGDRSWTHVFIGDIGLAPYKSGVWNDANHTRKVGPSWTDDWM